MKSQTFIPFRFYTIYSKQSDIIKKYWNFMISFDDHLLVFQLNYCIYIYIYKISEYFYQQNLWSDQPIIFSLSKEASWQVQIIIKTNW